MSATRRHCVRSRQANDSPMVVNDSHWGLENEVLREWQAGPRLAQIACPPSPVEAT